MSEKKKNSFELWMEGLEDPEPEEIEEIKEEITKPQSVQLTIF